VSGENVQVKTGNETSKDNGKLPPELNPKVKSLRCEHCNRFLAYYAIVEGTLAIKCKRCGHWTALDVTYVKVTTP
jgi:phage FluMu protein Com